MASLEYVYRMVTTFYRTNSSAFFPSGIDVFCRGTPRSCWGWAEGCGNKTDRVTRQELPLERHVVLQPWPTGHLSLWIHSSDIHTNTWIICILLLPSDCGHWIWHNMALLLLRASTASDGNNSCSSNYDRWWCDYEYYRPRN